MLTKEVCSENNPLAEVVARKSIRILDVVSHSGVLDRFIRDDYGNWLRLSPKAKHRSLPVEAVYEPDALLIKLTQWYPGEVIQAINPTNPSKSLSVRVPTSLHSGCLNLNNLAHLHPSCIISVDTYPCSLRGVNKGGPWEFRDIHKEVFIVVQPEELSSFIKRLPNGGSTPTVSVAAPFDKFFQEEVRDE